MSKTIPPVKKASYLVVWEIDIDVDAAIKKIPEKEAAEIVARKAWQHRNRRGSIANVFTVVTPEGKKYTVDLLNKTSKLIPDERTKVATKHKRKT